MLEKRAAQPRAFRRAFDDARNVRDDDVALRIVRRRKSAPLSAPRNMQHAQVGNFCRKRIGCDFGACVGKIVEQRGLARVGKADKPNVRHDAQFNKELFCFAFRALVRKTRRLIDRRFKAGVPPPALAPVQVHKARFFFIGRGRRRAVYAKVKKDFVCFGVFYGGAGRHGNQNVLTVSAMPIATLAVSAAMRLVNALKTQV